MSLLRLVTGLGVLFQEQIVGCRQVVMLVVFYGPLDRFSTETQACLKFHHEFFIDGAGHSVEIVVLGLWLI